MIHRFRLMMVPILTVLLAGCSGKAGTPAVQDAGVDEAARLAAENAHADSVITALRGLATADAGSSSAAASALGSWVDEVRKQDASFTPESLLWLPERRLTPDPGMKLTATFIDTLQNGSFGFVPGPDGTLAVDPQFRRFFEDDSAHVSIMADPMITVYDFPSHRRHVIDTGSAVAGDVWQSVAWLDARRLAVGGMIQLGTLKAPTVRIYDLGRSSVREGLAPIIRTSGSP